MAVQGGYDLNELTFSWLDKADTFNLEIKYTITQLLQGSKDVVLCVPCSAKDQLSVCVCIETETVTHRG